MTAKRFTIIYNEHCQMMQYVDNQKEEPNRWAIWNVSETTMKLNELAEENERLKSDNKKYIKGLEKAKATSQSWASDVRELREQNCQLERENKQLKKENQELIDYGRELLEYINAPPKHRKSIFDAVVYFKNKKDDME